MIKRYTRLVLITDLQKLAQLPGPYQNQARDMYVSLRLNLVSTVYDAWRETGYAWEHYNPDTGAGEGVQHFTGWTALITKVAAMPDLNSKGNYAFGSLGRNLMLDMHTVVITAIVVIIVFVFRRNLVRMYTAVLNRSSMITKR